MCMSHPNETKAIIKIEDDSVYSLILSAHDNGNKGVC